jgi:two-component system catabolic regulation response regulator CreB
MTEPATRPVRILLVEDNPDIRDTTSQLLEFAGFEVFGADGANHAREILLRDPVDVIITDAVMPDGDGYSLMTFVRASPALRRLPVIMVSAKAERSDRVEGVKRGADAYLPKPYVSAELVGLIRELTANGATGAASASA